VNVNVISLGQTDELSGPFGFTQRSRRLVSMNAHLTTSTWKRN